MVRGSAGLLSVALGLLGCAKQSGLPPPMNLPPPVTAPSDLAILAAAPGPVQPPVRAPMPNRPDVDLRPRRAEYETDFPLYESEPEPVEESYALELRQARPPGPVFSNAQIVEIAATVDEGEIAQAKLVAERSASPTVKHFAEHVLVQHTKSKRSAQLLEKQDHLQPEGSALASDLRKETERRLDTLEHAPPREFDRVYLSGQIDQHSRALQLLDGHLIPGATDAELRQQLEDARAILQAHLAQARRMWAELERPRSP